jgi:HEAT repeat protein
MNVFYTSKGKKVIIVYCDIVIDGKFYYYEDIYDLVKSKELTIEEYEEIKNAFSGMPPLDEVINEYARSEDTDVRFVLASLGFATDILVADPDPRVRAEVAYIGDHLEKLVNDPNPVVRSRVASNRYGLDILVNDPNHIVREVVAEQGYGLEKLVNDPSPNVRRAVAEKGYGLDSLVNDEDFFVRETAKKVLSERKNTSSILW